MKFQPNDVVKCILPRGFLPSFDIDAETELLVKECDCSHISFHSSKYLGRYKVERFVLITKGTEYNPVLHKIKQLSKRFEERKSNDIRS